jgi:carbon storage regulator
MLVLSRKKNEQIVLGPNENDTARIVVVEIRGDKVRLGIEAKKEWLVHRQEVFDAIHRHESVKEVAAASELENRTAPHTNIHMPCGWDAKARTLRKIEASFPQDVTQEEFWNFVMLAGSQFFGEQTAGRTENETKSSWNPQASLDAHLQRHQ